MLILDIQPAQQGRPSRSPLPRRGYNLGERRALAAFLPFLLGDGVGLGFGLALDLALGLALAFGLAVGGASFCFATASRAYFERLTKSSVPAEVDCRGERRQGW